MDTLFSASKLKPSRKKLLCIHHRTGLITVADVSMYLGHSFDEEMMDKYMREISSREDGLVSVEWCGVVREPSSRQLFFSVRERKHFWAH